FFAVAEDSAYRYKMNDCVTLHSGILNEVIDQLMQYSSYTNGHGYVIRFSAINKAFRTRFARLARRNRKLTIICEKIEVEQGRFHDRSFNIAADEPRIGENRNDDDSLPLDETVRFSSLFL
uniref:Uncharacterized protein n=1 Tax=Parascaris univalens TaxID=6257 RepID=A0A915B3M5_PARUN